jgi:beta-galactosidase GanA
VLSALLPTVETSDKQVTSGIVEIYGSDVVALFRRDGASRKPALVRRFRRSKKFE